VTGWAATERQALVRLARSLGPDAPVVPEGWRTADLVAHLYVRERRPDATPGVVLPGAFATYTGRVMASALRVTGYDGLLDRLESGPPLPLRPVDDAANLHEFFVHHEDIRRANGESTRLLPADLEEAMWARLRRAARVLLRRVDGVRVELSAGKRVPIGVGRGPTVQVSGSPGELLLFAFGRARVADVDLVGVDADVQTVLASRLGT
jgi:uncharacterized protein (TIGR03085 family)